MTEPKRAPEVEPLDTDALRALIKSVDTNPVNVKFPRDRWGFTSQVRKIGLGAASAVKGSKEKHDLLIATLAVLAAHIRARFDGDCDRAAARLVAIAAAAEQRGPRQRIAADPVAPTEMK